MIPPTLECPCGRARIGCEYHDPALQPVASVCPPNTSREESDFVLAVADALHARAPAVVAPSDWRLLGADDPEVSDDLIYAVPGGGVMGVPEALTTTTRAPRKPKLDRKTQWRTKDGRVLLFTEMSDAHLGHTIRMLIRKYEENLADSWSAAASFDSDSMASYYACGAADAVRPHSSLRHLQAEAKRRGLSW